MEANFSRCPQVDPDGPVPEDIALTLRTSNANKTTELARAEKLTVRQLYQRVAGKAGIRQIIGTPCHVADDLRTWFEGGACDGFNVCAAYSPGNVRDVVELVKPELQERKLFQTDYEGTTLRENLGYARCSGPGQEDFRLGPAAYSRPATPPDWKCVVQCGAGRIKSATSNQRGL